jgi:RHS repeat-associated protein
MNFNYTYDKSNRLLQTQNTSGHGNYEFTGVNSYDYDGNFLSLTRSNNVDNFAYDYYTGTNRLKKITGTADQFTYDYNGNLINDDIKRIYEIKYDYRNLITEFKRDILNHEVLETYLYQYRYDEAGNRISKTTFKLIENNFTLILKEYYIRDLSGKEVAVYEKLPNSDMTLKFYNVWGLSNEGQIFPDGKIYYYLKDHLGSIRAVYDNYLNLVSAQDLDPWGYELTGRAYIDTLKYKFTGKERDRESTYDYFGARYYDARIGRWLQMEPLYNKYLSFSPYQYGLLNPNIFKDQNGLGPRITILGSNIYIEWNIYYTTQEFDIDHGLNKKQQEVLNDMKKDIIKGWSDFTLNGKKYTVKSTVNLINTDMTWKDLTHKYEQESFFNFASNAYDISSDVMNKLKSHRGIGVYYNTIYMLTGEELKPYITTGAHEAGHTMDLVDLPSNENDDEIPSIMQPVLIKNGIEYRNYPSTKEYELIFKLWNIDINQSGKYNLQNK